MKGKRTYSIHKTVDGLIAIDSEKTRYRNRRPKDSFVDTAQLAFLELKAEYGTNYAVPLSELLKKMDCAESTFHESFCGGVQGLISYSEQLVVERFYEAIEGSSPELFSTLRDGLRTLYKVNPHSRYNYYQNTEFDMNLRTRFCVNTFPMAYWAKVMQPLLPSIDAFLAESTEYWPELPEHTKKRAYDLFARVFQWVVGLMAEEDLGRYSIMEQSKCLKEYTSLFCKTIVAASRTLFEDRYHIGTELKNITERIRQKNLEESEENKRK